MLLPGIGWPGGSPENTGIIIGVIAGAYVGALWLAAIAWTVRDVRERSQDPVTQAVALALVIVLSLPGWVLYLVLRPRETLADAYDRQLEEEALLQDLSEQLACPTCGLGIEDDYVACPQCATALKEPCASCERALTFAWNVCPWCAAPRAGRTPGPRTRRPATAAARADAEPHPAAPVPPSTRTTDPAPPVRATSTTLPATDSPSGPAAGGDDDSPFRRRPGMSRASVESVGASPPPVRRLGADPEEARA